MNWDAFKEHYFGFGSTNILSTYLTFKYISSPTGFGGKAYIFKGHTYINICRTENSVLAQTLLKATNSII